MWLPFMCPHLGTWPATQACALTRNRTSDPLVHRPSLNPLSYTSQGRMSCLLILTKFCTNHFVNAECQAFKQMTYTHPTHPGMPTVPNLKDRGNVSGHSSGSVSSCFPSEMEYVVQPEGAETIVPVGKAEFLLSTTLEDKAQQDMRNLLPLQRVGMLCG